MTRSSKLQPKINWRALTTDYTMYFWQGKDWSSPNHRGAFSLP